MPGLWSDIMCTSCNLNSSVTRVSSHYGFNLDAALGREGEAITYFHGGWGVNHLEGKFRYWMRWSFLFTFPLPPPSNEALHLLDLHSIMKWFESISRKEGRKEHE